MGFEKTLEDTSNWLYEDGFDATKSVYINKLQEVRKTGDLAERRKIETNGRQTSINDLQRVIEDQTKYLIQLMRNMHTLKQKNVQKQRLQLMKHLHGCTI